jgi:D-tyrosyl-tRNA(Tyr) deacylase
MQPAAAAAVDAAAGAQCGVRVVAQRVTSAALLIDNVSQRVTIGDGVILHVAFFAGATKDAVAKAVSTVCGTKTFILPKAGATQAERDAVHATDGTAATRPKPVALVESDCDVLVVPQATMAGKPKGKLMQYHGQANKDDSAMLYTHFCHSLRSCLLCSDVERDANGVPAAEVGTCNERRVLNGTFGNRQALDLSSPGPFTHVFDF